MTASLAFAESRVPSVTEDDLRAFHAKHFAQSKAPLNFFTSSEYHEDYEEDDGLGYYADGVKCTLTNEQIAMFRHSEIQRILRERRLRLENGSPEPDEELEAMRMLHARFPENSRERMLISFGLGKAHEDLESGEMMIPVSSRGEPLST